jgi:hypothetical protein
MGVSEARTARRWRVVIALIALAMMLAIAHPAHAGTSKLIEADITSARLMENGSVRVEAMYWCDEGYGSTPPEDRRAKMFFQHPQGYSETTNDEAICDGTTHTLVKRLRSVDGQEIDERLPVSVYFSVEVGHSPSNPYPGGLSALEADAIWLTGDGATSIMADIELGQLRLNDRGRFVVRLAYQCPTGWYVDSEDDVDWADIELRQIRSRDTSWDAWRTLAYDIVCDGTLHTVVKRIRAAPRSRPPIGLDRPVFVTAKIIIDGPAGEPNVSAYDSLTSLPY